MSLSKREVWAPSIPACFVVEDNTIQGVTVQVLSGATGQDVYLKTFRMNAPGEYELSLVIVNEGPVYPDGDLDGDGVLDSLWYLGIRAQGDWCCAGYKTVAISRRSGIVLWDFESSSPLKKLTVKGSDINLNGTQDLFWMSGSSKHPRRATGQPPFCGWMVQP